MQPQPIPFDAPLTVSLQAQEWNVVLAMLMDVPAPYRTSAPLIAKMQEQLVVQTQPGAPDVSQQDQQ